MKALSGWKTYAAAAAMIVLGGLLQQGYIDQTTFEWLAAIVAGGGLAFLRSAVAGLGAK